MTGEEIAERLHLARSTVATRHAPLDRHRRGHLPDGVASDGAPNDGLRGAVRPDFRAGNELLGESGPRLRNRSGVPNLSRNN